MAMSQAWKALERTAAKKLGGARSVTKGVGGADVHHEKFAIECKYRKSFSFINFFSQAKKYAKDGLIPIVVLKQAKTAGEYVLISLDDFAELTGYGPEAVEAQDKAE